jgi:uncharacterized protein (TIGR02453 family)
MARSDYRGAKGRDPRSPVARTPPPTRFVGFADTTASFFRALARRQNREWFQAHKREYEEGWATPMRLLLEELRERIDPLFARHPIGDPKVFRIHRDVRFSKDKSPFKTNVAGYVPLAGAGHGPGQPVPVYLQLGTEPFAGAGHYAMDGPQLDRYREALLDDRRGAAVARIVARLTTAGFEVDSHEQLKRVPRGVDPAHPRAALLRHKGLVVGFPGIPKRHVVSRALVDWLVGHVERARPLVEWLADLG